MINNLSLGLYLVFVISWFLHLGTRIPFLGDIRIDFILIAILSILALFKFISNSNNAEQQADTNKWLKILTLYIIFTIPFVEWPGSVIDKGLVDWIKVASFYYFTIIFITTSKKLKIFILVFLGCQTCRILEPLYLHITEGYWGSMASMADWEYLDRLAGAPSDIVNPNGLAFIICTVLPFLYFTSKLYWKNWLASAFLIPVCLYTLSLTGSRSGFIGTIIIFLGIVIKSKKRLLIGLSGLFVLILSFPLMSPDMQDRYLSIIGEGAKNEGTAVGRWDGVKGDFMVVLHRPIFGHGLGTSAEANANFKGYAQLSHNLYTEIGQELGLVGLAIFLMFARSIISNSRESQKMLGQEDSDKFLYHINNAIQLWLWMNLVLSFASFGLSSYEWYLFGGLSVAVRRLAMEASSNQPVKIKSSASKRRRSRKIILKPVVLKDEKI